MGNGVHFTELQRYVLRALLDLGQQATVQAIAQQSMRTTAEVFDVLESDVARPFVQRLDGTGVETVWRMTSSPFDRPPDIFTHRMSE